MTQTLRRTTHSHLARRLLKYASVSLISTVTSLTILGLLVGAVGMSAVSANLIAIAVGTVPSFELNRRWVWSLGDQRPHLAQIVPFALLSLSGLVLSSLAVRVADSLTAGDSRLLHTAAVELANLGSYGALWVFQFVLCDRLLFRSRPTTTARTDPPPVAADQGALVLVGGGAADGGALPANVNSQPSPSQLARGGQAPQVY